MPKFVDGELGSSVRAKLNTVIDKVEGATTIDNDITISGDLTVDTNTLHVDSTNNQVGIGTTTIDAGNKLQVAGNIGVGTSTSGDAYITFEGSTFPRNNYIGMEGYDNLVIAADEDNAGADSNIQLRVDASEVARITSTGLGIGTIAPTQKLDLEGANGARVAFTDTGTRRWSAGNDGTSFTIRDESGAVDVITADVNGDVQIDNDLSLGRHLFLSGGMSINDTFHSRHHVLRDVGMWSTNTSLDEGALVVQLGGTGNTFISATITIFRNYFPPVDVHVWGYSRSDNSDWLNEGARVSDPSIVSEVRFARGSTNNYPYVILSNNATPTSSTWANYVEVRIKEVTIAWTGADASFNQNPDNYVTTLTSDISGYTIDNTVTPTSPPVNVQRYTNDIAFYDDSGSQAVFFDGSTSRLGVGITGPAERLDVNGNILARGNLTAHQYHTRADFVNDTNRAAGLANGDIVMAEGLLYEYSSGSTTLDDLPSFVPAGIVQPEHFGAVGDGTTDDHDDLAKFFAYIPGFKAQMGAGKTYKDKGSNTAENAVHIIVSEGTFVDLDGNGATIDTSARQDDFTGNYLTVNPSTSITITSHPLKSVAANSGYVSPVSDLAAQNYTTTLERSSGTFSGLSDGQRAILRSNDVFPAAADSESDTLEYVGQWVTLRDVSSTTVGVIERIKNAYTTSPVLDTFNAATYVDIRNLRMIGTPRPTTDDDGQRGIEVFYAEKVNITNIHMERFDKYGISTDSCADVNIERCFLFTDQKAAANTSTAYGVAIHDVTENVNISDNTFSGYRHAVDLTRRGGGITRNVNIARNTIQGTWLAAIAMHGNHEQIIVQDNNILKCGDGINIRTPNTIVKGNYIQGCDTGINFTDTMFKTSIVDNHIEDVSIGIAFADKDLVTNPQDFIGEVYIAGNRIKNCAAQAIRLTPSSTGSFTGDVPSDTQIGSLLIADNVFEDVTSYAVWINGKWDNPVVDGLQAINCSSGFAVVLYEHATLGGAIRNVTYSTGNAPSAVSPIEISYNTGGVLTPAAVKNLNIRPFNTNDAMSIVGTDTDVNLIMSDNAGSGMLKMDGGDFSFLTGGSGNSATASGATENFYFAAGGVFKVGSGTGTAGGDVNMVTTGSSSAFLNLKGGAGRAKVVLGNDGAVVSSGTGDIEFRTGAGTTSTGTERAKITNSGTFKQTPFTVATLPTGSAGERAFVTDATATTFAATPTGGGSNAVPVYHDGTVWRIG